MRIDAALRYKIEYIETNMKDMDVQRISIKSFPRRRYIPLGVEEMIYMDETFYFYPTLVFYRGENRLFGAEITDTLTKQDGEMEVLDIEEGEYLVGYHKGPYPAILSSIARVRSARPDLTLGETVITQNIIDQFVEKNSANYITEIQIPIL